MGILGPSITVRATIWALPVPVAIAIDVIVVTIAVAGTAKAIAAAAATAAAATAAVTMLAGTTIVAGTVVEIEEKEKKKKKKSKIYTGSPKGFIEHRYVNEISKNTLNTLMGRACEPNITKIIDYKYLPCAPFFEDHTLIRIFSP